MKSIVILLFAVLALTSCALNEENPSGSNDLKNNLPAGDISSIASTTLDLLMSGSQTLPLIPMGQKSSFFLSSSPPPGFREIIMDLVPAGDLANWTDWTEGGSGTGYAIEIDSFTPDGTRALEVYRYGTSSFCTNRYLERSFTLPADLNLESIFSFDVKMDLISYNGYQYSNPYFYFYRNGQLVGGKTYLRGQNGDFEAEYRPGQAWVRHGFSNFYGTNSFGISFMTGIPDMVRVTLNVKGCTSGGAKLAFDNFKVLIPITAAVDISTPPDNSVFDEGSPVTFTAQITGQVSDLTWKTNYPTERIIGTGETITVSDLATDPATGIATHTITVTGTKPGGGTVSDSIQVGIQQTIFRIEIIKIEPLPASDGDVFEVSSRKASTTFRADCYNLQNVLVPGFPVKWELINGEVDLTKTVDGVQVPTLRSQILQKLGLTVMKIGNLKGQLTTTASRTTFISYLSGEIQLKASIPTNPAVNKVITIKILQPTVYVDIKVIQGGISLLEYLPQWPEVADQIWGQENLIRIKKNDANLIPNQEFTPLPEDESYETLVLLLPASAGKISFHNTIVADGKANLAFFTSKLSYVVPRQSDFLLKTNRSFPEKFLNVYVADYFIDWMDTDNPISIVFPAGVSMISDTLHPNPEEGYFDYSRARLNIKELLNNVSEGGIFLPGIFPNSEGGYDLDKEKILAHEIGHLIIDVGDEHDFFVSGPENLMWWNTSGGEKLEPEQFIEALDYGKNKTAENFFLVEE